MCYRDLTRLYVVKSRHARLFKGPGALNQRKLDALNAGDFEFGLGNSAHRPCPKNRKRYLI